MDILTVTQLNNTVRGTLESNPVLQNVCVRGEITNYKRHSSGHVYFALKDESASIPCVMYRGSAQRLRFEPTNGLSVLASGRISVFVQGGYYQLVCSSMHPEGIGELELAFRQMFERLQNAGLFDERHKKPIPKFPHTIGVVTSPTGKAIHDIVETLKKRCPLVKVVLIPVKVQGDGAAEEIAAGIRLADSKNLADVLIVGRGGGSDVELWPFNEEVVARAIYECRTPVISAVGHEPDVAISDYVADRRAATPTQAAMIAVVDQSVLRQRIETQGQNLTVCLTRQITESRRQLAVLASNRLLQNPMEYLAERRMQLDLITERFRGTSGKIMDQKRQTYLRLSAALEALSPLKILQRGYGFVSGEAGNIVSSVAQLRPGDRLRLHLSDGAASVTVEELEEQSHA